MSEDGGPLKKAHPYITAMIMGTSYLDPGNHNPLPSINVCSDPIKKLKHNKFVDEMLDYLFSIIETINKYPDCPSYPYVKSKFINALYQPISRKVLSDKSTNYDRWDSLINNITDVLDEL